MQPSQQTLLFAGAAFNAVPYGTDLIFDIKRRLQNERVSLIFDVGANIGQSAHVFRREFPDAKILSFEPDPNTFKHLQSSVSGMKNIEIFNCGFSRQPGALRFDFSWDATEMHRLADDQSDTRFPLVKVTTVDQFCLEHRIDRIDYLKIDTEGHDLEVLKGAGSTLARGAASIVVTECSLSTSNQYHVSFFEIQQHLESFGYTLFGIFDQNTPYNRKGLSEIVYSNCVYISPTVAARN